MYKRIDNVGTQALLVGMRVMEEHDGCSQPGSERVGMIIQINLNEAFPSAPAIVTIAWNPIDRSVVNADRID